MEYFRVEVHAVHSMTGYASMNFDFPDYRVTIEVKSLNNKFFEARFRLPPVLERLEERLRRILRGFVQRGKVDVFVKLIAREERELESIRRLILKYRGIMERIREETGVDLQATLSEIIAMKNLVNPFEEIVYTDIPDELVEEAFGRTIASFQESRAREGEHTKNEILGHLRSVSDSLDRIEPVIPGISERYRAQLRDRIQTLLDGKADETRILMEAGIMASRIDVSEEISRLRGHAKRFYASVGHGGACGRELDFITQEMGREVNTIGSKVPEYEVASEVVNMKTSLDKIKEQVRNIE